MPKYAVAFDVDTRAMRADLVDREGLTQTAYETRRTHLYRSEVPTALAACGTIRRKQGSLYHLEADANFEELLLDLRSAVKDHAPTFRRYVRNVMIYPIGEGRDVTTELAERKRKTVKP